ncbi:cytochrome-c peroxidase [Mucilaginibacter sp. OK098]|uniref:cytochrome-c peroxidase n=1 Tax=Mucilaginibacter sp. OK098 TaxID=1855297 RepID=UPI0009140B2C|nr:cytochrome c peroxidase [Mucilaginibacter sp. OK098]SHM83182.1 cytochrome c peroxidase [Mucilaginibacter sp. OK098]
MRKFIFIPLLIFAITGYTFYACKPINATPEKVIAQTLLTQIDSFSAVKNKLLITAQSGRVNEKELQHQFLQLRLAYKKFEWAAEYFNPAVARFVNGPPVQEVEMVSGQVFEPAGLQVIEGLLFPKYNIDNKKELTRQLALLQDGCDKFKTYYANIDILDWQVFDAAKLEVFRILALGLTGFDNPFTLKSMQEAVVSLAGVKEALAWYEGKVGDENLPGEIDAATHYLKNNTNFNAFDRAAFITQFGNPITTSITNLEQKLKIQITRYNRLLNQDAKTLFDRDAFNVNAYAPDPESFSTEKKVALGRVLFADPILSGDNKRSCQSCHQPEKAFTDGMVKNTMIGSKQLLRRNTPTLINAALQASQFYDLRAKTLEDQAISVVQNKEEMHGSMAVAVNGLWQNKGYRALFSAAFQKKNRTGIDTLEVMNALGSYVRSLTLLNSRFDEYMRGNKTAMNQQEINGFNLFMGKAKCATCHYMPLFNGSFPPRYVLIESEVIGVPQTTTKAAIDTDMGRYNQLKINAFKHAFKITTVRNAARTAPYMHNGVFTTLQQVMDFYNKGGGAGLGYKVDNQTLAADKLNLTDKESAEVIAFIKSLDSK